MEEDEDEEERRMKSLGQWGRLVYMWRRRSLCVCASVSPSVFVHSKTICKDVVQRWCYREEALTCEAVPMPARWVQITSWRITHPTLFLRRPKLPAAMFSAYLWKMKVFPVFIPLWMLKFCGQIVLDLNSTVRLFSLPELLYCFHVLLVLVSHSGLSSWLLKILPFRRYSENQKARKCQEFKPKGRLKTWQLWHWSV